MADQGHDDAERRAALERFRMMREEATDPLAAQLMSEIISELEMQVGTGAGRPASPRNRPRNI